ncbi:LysE family translocator [Schlegelella sp. S2-27]|uniref:LysE family translocator n=1 Tax=Caldimonas mangrovi TaxID=2944811 RepID=A0ABT0YSG9_9BURK|nr:LysE family translocator [Caldimonas mangrovi]MCM5681681.1 LysE family translocator [Caldimonas mangrovi]
MFTLQEIALFALAAAVLALTPGPNMVYYVSRTLCQGRGAGLLSLAGVVVGFLFHLTMAALGLTAVLMAVPFAFEAIKFAGAAYLLWMAWQAVRPGGGSPFEPRALPHDPPAVLFRMGLVTNLLNPKVAVFYVSFFPQFLHPERGDLLLQSFMLGGVQITVSTLVNFCIVLGAAQIARFLQRSPGWMRAQRWIMGTVLGLLAARLAFERR